MVKRTIDDHFENFDEQFNTIKRTAKAGILGAGLGFVAGAMGGVYLGESINDYVEALRQAPDAIQYAVDGVSALVCGSVGAGIGGTLAKLPGLYKLFKRF